MISWKDKPRRSVLIVTAVVSVMALAGVALFTLRLNRSIESERERAAAGSRVEVEKHSLNAPATEGMTALLNTADIRSIAVYNGSTYLASSGGLVKLDHGGSPSKRYTTLDGLPENDLTALTVFRGRLFVGTSSSGLVSFDDHAFTGYSFLKPKATRVSVLVPTESELLIGTMDGGLFEFDGDRFSRRYNSTVGAGFTRITALLPYESRLYIGTQDNGLYVWREGRIEHFSTDEGMPSPRVTGLVRLPSNLSASGVIAVATDFGVAALSEDDQIKLISNRPNITSLAFSGGRVWAGLFGGGVVDIGIGEDVSGGARSRSGVAQSEATGLPPSPAVVCSADGKLWALTTVGAFFRQEDAAGPAFERLATEGSVLSSGHVTSVALDTRGRLWVGYFDQGIDLIGVDTADRLSHLQDERLREINFLRFDPNQDRMLAATSMGLIVIDERLRQTVFTREQNGLVNDSVAHVSLIDASTGESAGAGSRGTAGGGMLLATAGGLTELQGARARSLTAFHGLASNHLYTSAVVGSELFVGSLAGLVELEGLRVSRTYKTSNSRLSHDWVTALAAANGVLFVGTNGGGVDELLPTGEWVNFGDEIGHFEVNQNAMHYDGERLYVGTSDRGVLVYNTRDRRWGRISAGLTSQNVTALTSDDESIYVGTMNGLVRIEKKVIQ